MGPLVVTAALWGPHVLWSPGSPQAPSLCLDQAASQPGSPFLRRHSTATSHHANPEDACPSCPLHPAGLTVRTEAPGMEDLQRSLQKRQRRRQEGRKGREEEAGEQEQGASGAAEATATEGPGTSDGASRRAWPDTLHHLQVPS